MRQSTVNYDDIVAGRHQSRPVHPFEGYVRERGARVLANVFSDPEIRIVDDTILNLTQIISSGRRQEFEKLTILVPKCLLPHSLIVSRQLMVLEAVVIECNETSDQVVYQIYYPDVIWMESAYWGARNRTELHPRCLTPDELDQIKSFLSLRQSSPELRRLLSKSLGLDEKLSDRE